MGYFVSTMQMSCLILQLAWNTALPLVSESYLGEISVPRYGNTALPLVSDSYLGEISVPRYGNTALPLVSVSYLGEISVKGLLMKQPPDISSKIPKK